MTPAARDRALAREMRAEKNLHPALETPDGHYRFLRAISEGMVGGGGRSGWWWRVPWVLHEEPCWLQRQRHGGQQRGA